MFASEDAMIHLDHVTKLYGTVIGVNDLTVSVRHGAHGLVGPNGSGKTTLLRMLTGQLYPTLGRVRVLGKDPWNNAELLRAVGFCPEHDALYNNVSGLEWVRFLLELHGFSRHEARLRAEQTLEQVGLAEARHRRLSEYSRGMRQRAKLAQAMAHDPELLILDEPFGGLDPVARHAMIELLKQRVRAGKGLLMASHLLHEVEAVTDSFLLICGGRLLASGTAEEVHSLLEDLPKEIHICTDDPRLLGQHLMEAQLVESVRLLGTDRLLVSTRSPAELFQRLPHLVATTKTRIVELRSTDSSLQSLFDVLLKIHHGITVTESRE